MKFLKWLMCLNAVAAFSGFFVMAAGAGSSVIVFVSGQLLDWSETEKGGASDD